MSPSSSDFTISTFFKNHDRPRHIRTEGLTEEDLEVLKKEDLFAYYSIPLVKEADLRHQSDDVAALRGSSGDNQAQTVERRTRVSFECHDTVFFGIQDLATSESDADEDEQSDEDTCLFDLLFENDDADEEEKSDEEFCLYDLLLAHSRKRKAECLEKEGGQ
jgi:hypothetical protein